MKNAIKSYVDDLFRSWKIQADLTRTPLPRNRDCMIFIANAKQEQIIDALFLLYTRFAAEWDVAEYIFETIYKKMQLRAIAEGRFCQHKAPLIPA